MISSFENAYSFKFLQHKHKITRTFS